MNVSQWGEWTLMLLPGLAVSLQLIAATVVFGLPLSLALGLGSGSRRRVVAWLCIAVIETGRGMPALVLLYLVYFGLPLGGLILPAFACATIALSINFAAYTSEVVRSAVDAVPAGQREASDALGLSRAVTFRKVILPQAIRVATPPMIGWVISTFQATSLAFVIAVPELMSRGYEIAASSFQYLSVFVLVGVLYAAIGIPGSRLVSVLEARQERRSA